MSNNGPLKVVSSGANKIGALFDRTLDNCPYSESGLCTVATEKGRKYPCMGGQFRGCTIYIRLKNGGTV